MVIFRSPLLLQSLTSDMLLKKTLKLSNKDIIGSGGYGTVYRLAINESAAFAVKRLNRGTAERDRGFERELEAMADIKHRNIVTLHGYYTAPHYNLLIYELMPNGSLDSFLYGMHILCQSRSCIFATYSDVKIFFLDFKNCCNLSQEQISIRACLHLLWGFFMLRRLLMQEDQQIRRSWIGQPDIR